MCSRVAVPVPPSASAAPSASATAKKPPSAKQSKPAGCPDGWTRNTQGVCVDWCETDGDCDDGSTCQDSDSIDPDLGKIKT